MITIPEALAQFESHDQMDFNPDDIIKLLESMQWRSMETGRPYDENSVLLYKNGEYFTAAWVSGEHGPGWCTPDGYQIFNPTHWMPIPKHRNMD